MSNKKRIAQLFTYLTVSLVFVLVIRLWQLQVLKGDYYFQQSLKNRIRVVKIPAPRGIIYDRNGTKLVKNAPLFIASLMPDISEKSLDIAGLSKLLNISEDDIRQRLENRDRKSLEPVQLKTGLSFEEVALIEARRSDFPGLIIETDVTRHYPYGKTASHLIGYLSLPTVEQLRKQSRKEIVKDTPVGQWGVEALYDETLRGIPGRKYIEVDALGRQLRTINIVPPKRGDDIYLSIDLKTQQEAERAFSKRAGALMALDPNNGKVIAFVSLPAFDPNEFVRGITEKRWRQLLRHPGHPMLNRVLQSQYPPGSVFKLIVAITALEEGMISPSYSVNCKGLISVGRWKFRCWKRQGHGLIGLKRAIIESCDVYFYELGRMLGIDRIAKYARAFGLGSRVGPELCAERDGLIPTTKWKKRVKGRPWYLGETFNAAIGQGYVSVTPAQAAVMVSAIANGGTIYRPSVLLEEKPEVIGKLALKPSTVRFIKSAMYSVVVDPKGTGWRARSGIVSIAGKTGTAQVVSRPDDESASRWLPEDHAWFVAFSPVRKP
ncbi:MAG: penicillin-binding protein 2, partial [Nitrospirae bacterium]